MRKGKRIFSQLRIPAEEEVIGKVIQRLGGRRFRVNCSDGKERICTLCNKSRFQRIREEYMVVLKVWIGSSGNTKGTIVYVYSPSELIKLAEKGYLNFLSP